MDINKIKSDLRKFAEERDWEQFHSPKNLAMALSGVVGELSEIFQWLTKDQSDKENIVKDLDKIIDFIGQLQEINTEKVEPLSNPLEMTAKTREDAVNSDNNKEIFLKNAPNSDEDYFLVPKVVE